MVNGYEGGVDDLEARLLRVRDIRLNANSSWYYGRHEEAYADEKKTNQKTVPALILSRPWYNDEEA